MRLWPGSALVLVVSKILESFQRVLGGKIHAATRAEETGYATLAALVHQRWPGYRTRRKFSQSGFLLLELYAWIGGAPAKLSQLATTVGEA